MAINKVNTRVVLKNDELSNWLSSTSIDLKKGELAFAKMENGKYELRIGQDGKYDAGAQLQISATQVVGLTNELNDLSTSNYVLTSTVDTLNPQTATADDVMAYLIAQAPDQAGKTITAADLHNGDTLVIREKIADKTWNYASNAYEDTVQWQHAAYVYDTNIGKFKAMDGTYNADSVYFDEDLKYTVALGTLSKPTSYSTLSSKGMSLEDLMKTLMSKETFPTKTNPTYTLAATGSTNEKEVGDTYVRPSATLKLTSNGKWTRDGTAHNAGCTIPASSATISCTTADFEATQSNTAAIALNGSFSLPAGTDNQTFGDTAVTYTFSAEASHTAGSMPKTNLENDWSAAQIAAGSDWTNDNPLTASASFKGYRSYFWGYKDEANMLDIDELTSDQIRGLQNNGKAFPAFTNKSTTNFTVPAGTKQIIFAAPAGTLNGVIEAYNNSALDSKFDFSNEGKKVAKAVAVEGKNAYTAIDYDIWYLNAGAAFGSSVKFAVKVNA